MSAYTPARTSGARPIAFLGLAGVVYLDDDPAVPARLAHVSAWGRWARDVLVPETTAEHIAAVAADFDIVWISEWGTNAHTAFRDVLDLPAEPWPSLPVQFDKLAAIRAYAGELPWAWIDDRLVIDQAACPDGIVFATDPRRGLAAVDIAAVRAGLSERTGR